MALMETGQTTEEKPATCNCTKKCEAGAVNTACPVCATNLSGCIGKAPEPTGNLDSKTSQDVLSLLKVTSQKFAQTIVMITHNEEIAQMADRIIRIEDGRIVTKN